MTLPSAESNTTAFDIDVVYEDKWNRPVVKSPMFLYVTWLLPFFLGKKVATSSAPLRDTAIGKKHTIRIVLSEELVPSAWMQSLMLTHAEIRLNLGLYLAFWALPCTLSVLDKTIHELSMRTERGMNLDELCAMEVPDTLINEVHELLIAWERSEASGFSKPGFKKLTFPRPNFVFPALVFIIGHELGHYYQDNVCDRSHNDPFKLAESAIRECLEQSIYMMAFPDNAAAVKKALSDKEILEAWKKEVAADQYAFFAIRERFHPKYGGKRIPSVSSIVYEPTFQSTSETISYAYVAAEIVFGILKLLELYSEVREKPLSIKTHPPVDLRREIFTYARARDASMSLPEFIGKRYGYGFITRAIMDEVLAKYVDRLRVTGRDGGISL